MNLGYLYTGSSSGYTGTITSSGYNSTVQYLRYPSDSSGTVYYTAGDTISVTSGDSVYFYCNAGPTNNIYLDGTSVGTTSYTWTPDADFEVAFTASIASWGRIDITRNVPSTPGVTITYGGETIYTTTEDDSIILPTDGQYMSTDIVISGTDVYNTEVYYDDEIIVSESGTFTKTLLCANKVMDDYIAIDVQIEDPAVPDNNCITFTTYVTTATLATANSFKNWNGTLQYSYDKVHWNDWDGTTSVSFSNGVLHLRGSNNTYLTGGSSLASENRFVITTIPSIGGDVTCTGNIETLLDWKTVKAGNHPTMGNYCFSYLFYQCTALGSAPSLLGTSIPSYAYMSMFYGCAGLTTPPALDATLTTSSIYCYAYMFYGCTKLTSVPTLPSSTLAQSCYAYMFYGCTKLTTTPALPATTLGPHCYYRMFRGCTALTQLPALPATSVSNQAYYQMFYGCSKIMLSTTQTGNYQTAYRIPTSGTGTVGTNSLQNMFASTGGTFTGTPAVNTTYYTSNTVIS